MKYKRGSIVEIFVQNEFRHHSWRCAQIVSGNGSNYTVSYDVYPGFTNKEDVEGISLRSIRPCPPLLEISECWVPGDVVEVFHNLSWNMAVVLNDFGLDQFKVRLVGSSQELEVTKSELRVRQSYQNGKWIVIGKVPQDDRHANYTKDTKGYSYRKDLCIDTYNNHHLMDSRIIPSKSLKRASPCRYAQAETNKGRAKKFRKETRCVRMPATSSEKVDTVANSREIMLLEKDLHTVKESINRTYVPGSSHALALELNDTASHMSSSGSCSDNSYKPYEIYSGSFVEDIEGRESDAESICQFEYVEETDHVQSFNNEVADEIHKLELLAYRSTMEALHASGPLTWEKETMVTNLRMSLHISNDEHLIMLKNLISADSNTLIR